MIENSRYAIFSDKDLEKRIACFDKNAIDISNQEIHIIEDKRGGEADITLKLANPCIGFKKLEDKKCHYFDCNNAADYLLFERKQYSKIDCIYEKERLKEEWKLHIFELKKTVKSKEWCHIKVQFLGALLNAMCLAGFMGISIDKQNIFLYTAYQNDKIKDTTNPLDLRAQMANISVEEEKKDYSDWFNDFIEISAYEVFRCKHQKIVLKGELGKAEYCIGE